MKYISLILATLILASCATPFTHQYATNAEYLAAHPNPPKDVRQLLDETARKLALIPRVPAEPTLTTSPITQDGASGWDVLGAIVAIPLLIPLAAIANYPRYGLYRTTCRSYTYKDQYHTTCY